MLYINKDGIVLEEADKFIYSEDLYLIYPLRSILYRTKYYSSNTTLNKPNARAYSKEYKCYIQRFWNLVAAPKEYLLEKRFKPKR